MFMLLHDITLRVNANMQQSILTSYGLNFLCSNYFEFKNRVS